MSELKLWAEFFSPQSKLAKAITEHNTAVDSLTAAETKLADLKVRLTAELADDSPSRRKTADILGAIERARVEHVDQLLVRRSLAVKAMGLANEAVTETRSAIERQEQKVSKIIETVKEELEAVGAGIASIPSPNGRRLVELNPNAAEIQFEHRAKQNSRVVPMLDELRELRDRVPTLQAKGRYFAEVLSDTRLQLDRFVKSFGVA